MKCYVCFYTTFPGAHALFWYRKDAEIWKKLNGGFAEYTEMEIE